MRPGSGFTHDDFLGQPIAECDPMISHALQRLPTLTDQISAPVKPMRSPHRTRAQPTQLHQALKQLFGVDLTRVPTLGIDTVLVFTSEIGPDLISLSVRSALWLLARAGTTDTDLRWPNPRRLPPQGLQPGRAGLTPSGLPCATQPDLHRGRSSRALRGSPPGSATTLHPE